VIRIGLVVMGKNGRTYKTTNKVSNLVAVANLRKVLLYFIKAVKMDQVGVIEQMKDFGEGGVTA